ncbi:MAG: hypothetical protein N4Q32_02120, partial [Neisseriaceae bacterium]|nr:hypothetical protein [Neisseriaceae bacterium]
LFINADLNLIKKYNNDLPFKSIKEINQVETVDISSFNQDINTILEKFPKYEWPYPSVAYYPYGNDYYLFDHWQFIEVIPKLQPTNLESITLNNEPKMLDKSTINQLKKHSKQLAK